MKGMRQEIHELCKQAPNTVLALYTGILQCGSLCHKMKKSKGRLQKNVNLGLLAEVMGEGSEGGPRAQPVIRHIFWVYYWFQYLVQYSVQYSGF